jgi:glycosyltransferase involved in cell wall biosynthesis
MVDGVVRPGDRVVILVQNLPVPFDRRVWLEATHLATKGLKVTVICPSAEGYPVGGFGQDGVDIRRYKSPREAESLLGYAWEYTSSITKMLFHLTMLRIKAPIQVIQYCNPPDLLFLAVLPFKILSKTKVIFDQHDLGPELMTAKGLDKFPFMSRIALGIEKASYKTADHVISTNKSYAAIASKRGKKSDHDVFIVRSGPKKNWADSAKESPDFRKEHKFQIGYIGVMGYQDGVDLLLRAFQLLVNEHGVDAYLTLAGGGTEFENLRQLAQEMGISSRVEFYGKVRDDQLLKDLIKSSDVCVATDRDSELNNLSTMNKIIEYMALSKPMVLFDSKESRFSAGDAAIYVEPDDYEALAKEIAALLKDPSKMSRFGDIGRQRFLSELCWENQHRQLESAYWIHNEER